MPACSGVLWNVDVNVCSLRVRVKGLQVNTRENATLKPAFKKK